LEYLNGLYEKRDKYFGNARSARKIVERAVKKQNLRMASLPSEERTKTMMETVTVLDLKEITIDQKEDRKRMGFR